MSNLQQIFRESGPNFRALPALPAQHLKVLRAVEVCRSSTLGGHVDQCDECGHLRISYNSCRNRHCPKCQALVKERWLENRRQDLLPVGYFHVVFTIPESINPIALRNQKELYSILFRAASQTLNQLACDKKYLSQYTHRVAISNSRIVKSNDSKVTFKWRDYRDNNQVKLMTLDAHEFIRRFLMHVLPAKFVKIRHYGILSNRYRNTKLKLCKTLLKVSTSVTNTLNAAELLLKLTGRDIFVCPLCGKGKMLRKIDLPPNCCSPPVTALTA